MKNIKTLLIFLLLAVFGGSGAMAQTVSQNMAANVLMDYLKTRGFSPVYDSKDNSVNFKKGDILFWITMERENNGMLYTLHRRHIRLVDPKDSPTIANRKRENAEKAVNLLNNKAPYKAYLNGNRVEFTYSSFAPNPKDYTLALGTMLNDMDNIKKDFDFYYKISRNKTDSIHKYWLNLDTIHEVVPQQMRPTTVSGRNLSIQNIAIRNLGAGNEVLSDYNQALRKNKTQFVQPKVTVIGKDDGTYKIGVKIINPKGKIYIPTKGAEFTTVTTFNIKKGGKAQEVTLESFGSAKPDFWQPGEYKILFFEDNHQIYEDAFNIL